MDHNLEPQTFGKGAAADQPLVRQTLSEQIYERLKADIISHRISFGEKLVNRELQEKFGTSSTPIRDAINHLYVDGLLAEITRSGARVISFDLNFALEINEMVMVLNRGAISCVARRGRLQELADLLEPLLAAQRSSQTVNEYIQLDHQFHQAFFQCSGNSHLLQVYRQYTVLFEMMARMSMTGQEQRQHRFEQHQKLYELCRAEDEQGLLDEMGLHYLDAARWFTAHGAVFNP